MPTRCFGRALLAGCVAAGALFVPTTTSAEAPDDVTVVGGVGGVDDGVAHDVSYDVWVDRWGQSLGDMPAGGTPAGRH